MLKPPLNESYNLFSAPFQDIDLTDDGRSLMHSVVTYSSVRAGIAAEAGDSVDSARWGAVPRKIAILTGLLVAFDYFVGGVKPSPLKATRNHVDRAKKLHALLDGSRRKWLQESEVPVAPQCFRTSQRTADFQAGLPNLPPPPVDQNAEPVHPVVKRARLDSASEDREVPKGTQLTISHARWEKQQAMLSQRSTRRPRHLRMAHRWTMGVGQTESLFKCSLQGTASRGRAIVRSCVTPCSVESMW